MLFHVHVWSEESTNISESDELIEDAPTMAETFSAFLRFCFDENSIVISILITNITSLVPEWPIVLIISRV